jgi:hypothetical protein
MRETVGSPRTPDTPVGGPPGGSADPTTRLKPSGGRAEGGGRLDSESLEDLPRTLDPIDAEAHGQRGTA